MKGKKKTGNFELCDSGTFGFGRQISEDSSGARKILGHFNGGFKLNYVRNEDCTYTEDMQNNLL